MAAELRALEAQWRRDYQTILQEGLPAKPVTYDEFQAYALAERRHWEARLEESRQRQASSGLVAQMQLEQRKQRAAQVLPMEISYEQETVDMHELELRGVRYGLRFETNQFNAHARLTFWNKGVRVLPERLRVVSCDECTLDPSFGDWFYIDHAAWYDIYIGDALLLHLDRVTSHRGTLGEGVKRL